MRRVSSNQNVLIALFLNIMFLNRSLQHFSYLSKLFRSRILESASVSPISIQIPVKPPNNVFYIASTQLLLMLAQNIKNF